MSSPSVLDVLRSMIHLLDAAWARAGWNRPAHLVRVTALPAHESDNIDIGLRQLPEGLHPAAALEGFVAPLDWRVFGIVCEGRGFPLDRPPPRRARPSDRMRVIELVARDGTRVSALRPRGGALAVYEPPMTNEVAGRVPLLLCRAMGVPVVGGRLAAAPAAAPAPTSAAAPAGGGSS